MSQTMRQRAAIHAYIEHGAHHDVLARGQLKRDADSAIADFQAARLRYEERQPEPCQFCAVEEEAPVTLPEFVLLTAKGVVWIACALSCGLGLLWLCDVAGQYFGSHA